MQTLRRLGLLARLVLVGFALSMLLARAAPLLRAQAMDSVCTAAGAVLLADRSDGGGAPGSGHLPDCPLCLHAGAAPPAPRCGPALLRPQAQPVRASATAAPVLRSAAPPLPPRGPPPGLPYFC